MSRNGEKNAQVENLIWCILTALRRNLKTPNLLKDPVFFGTIRYILSFTTIFSRLKSMNIPWFITAWLLLSSFPGSSEASFCPLLALVPSLVPSSPLLDQDCGCLVFCPGKLSGKQVLLTTEQHRWGHVTTTQICVTRDTWHVSGAAVISVGYTLWPRSSEELEYHFPFGMIDGGAVSRCTQQRGARGLCLH